MYYPDHLLLCVLIYTPAVVIDRLSPRPIPTYTDSGSLLIFSLSPKYPTDTYSDALSILSLPRNISCSHYRSFTTQTDSNRYLFWVVINFISTPEILVVVVIDRLQPRPIPTDTYSWLLSILSLSLKYWS